MKLFFSTFLCSLASVANALACDQHIVLSNWKSCSVRALGDQGGASDWNAIPVWAKDKKIQPYFMGDPRLLANHGLCNERYRRVVLCLPGWEESQDKNACWYLICSGYQG